MPDINFAALDRFSNTTFDSADTIANLDRDNASFLEEAGTYKGALGALRRSDREKANNNAVRTELLKSLGEAFNIDGMNDQGNGKVTFNKQFMDRLGQLLGADLKREDFGIAADGSVASGRPLTQRRITAILHKAVTYVAPSQDFSSYVYADKTRTFIEQLNKMGGNQSEAVKNLTSSLKAAADTLYALDVPGAIKPCLLRYNGLHEYYDQMVAFKNKNDPGNESGLDIYKKWGVHFSSASTGKFEPGYANGDADLKKILNERGLKIDFGLASLDSQGTDLKSLNAFHKDFQQKLQVFVKTACDAWDKVQQGQIPVDKFLAAFNADSGQGPTLDAFLNNMQALEAAG